MGLLSSLFSGVTGLNASGNTISVIGDNIANSNTTGYKSSRTEFVDVLSGNLGSISGEIGQGTRLSSISQNFAQGSLETTGVTTDLAIDGGGFFIVQDTTGVFYTRAGTFRLDSNQILVNALGQAVQGFGITPGGIPNGALGSIDLSSVSSSPSPTTQVEVNVNLDPQDNAIPGGAGAFDHLDPVGTSNFQTGIRIFDSLGNPRNILIYFRKDDVNANQWHWYAGTNRAELDLSNYGAPFNTFAPTAADPNNSFFPIQSGTLDFDSQGAMTLETNAAHTIQYDADGNGLFDDATTVATPGNGAGGWNFVNGAAVGQLLGFDFGTSITEGGAGTDRTTQFGGSAPSGVNNFVRFMNQDGFSAGTLQNIQIDEDGFVTGQFSNGQTVRLAQVGLADFPNENGLSRGGKNNFVETLNSGTAIIGSPNQSGFGAVRSGFLELSNTDLAEEFVRMILSQRAFQANTRTISTTNELLAQLVTLGQ